ncbi:MAG: hypothetical protein A2Y33_02720 [Spirochaetes bacterium GWF1_51_8]|nr:MAG: hypothetical protein A2Y33_02720 [Spirochaetes bacterium GWF1_51_8]
MYEFGASPFKDEKGLSKNIFEIVYQDLQKLKENDIEEGFNTEYKSVLDNKVKEKIPNIISALANGNGGWLFIGIENKTKILKDIPKADYEQTISNILKELVDPIPKFEVRFLEKPSNNNIGILVIWVPEGENTPYISRGKIYRRTGSDTSPIEEIKDRYSLDKLYEKSEKQKQKIKDFCKKDICIEPYSVPLKKLGFCSIYIIPEYDLMLHKSHLLDLGDYISNRCEQKFHYENNIKGIDSNLIFPFFSYSYKSIVLRNSKILDDYNSTIGWHQFFDGSAKFHSPLSYINNNALANILADCPNYEKYEVFNNFMFIDGYNFFSFVVCAIGQYYTIMKELSKEFAKAYIILKLENVQNNVLTFQNNTFRENLISKGLRFSDQDICTIENNYNSQENILNIINYFIVWICLLFGYNIEEADKLFDNFHKNQSDFNVL